MTAGKDNCSTGKVSSEIAKGSDTPKPIRLLTRALELPNKGISSRNRKHLFILYSFSHKNIN
jgi:hypothetical protein